LKERKKNGLQGKIISKTRYGTEQSNVFTLAKNQNAEGKEEGSEILQLNFFKKNEQQEQPARTQRFSTYAA
jgi:hypothetical protein